MNDFRDRCPNDRKGHQVVTAAPVLLAQLMWHNCKRTAAHVEPRIGPARQIGGVTGMTIGKAQLELSPRPVEPTQHDVAFGEWDSSCNSSAH